MKNGFGAALRKAMEAAGIRTQSELAARSGVSQPAIGRMLADQRLNITVDTYMAVCRGLGVTSDHFAEFMELPSEKRDNPAEPTGHDKQNPRENATSNPDDGTGL